MSNDCYLGLERASEAAAAQVWLSHSTASSILKAKENTRLAYQNWQDCKCAAILLFLFLFHSIVRW